jgi:hypothetical protein
MFIKIVGFLAPDDFTCAFSLMHIYTGGSCLMRISLVQILLLPFFKTFYKYLPYANCGLFISLVQFYGQKIAK